jgi:hypothetical protein
MIGKSTPSRLSTFRAAHEGIDASNHRGLHRAKLTSELAPIEIARLVRGNAEALFLNLTGQPLRRAFNPDCPPKHHPASGDLIAAGQSGMQVDRLPHD